MALCLGTCVGPRGVGVSYERGTPVQGPWAETAPSEGFCIRVSPRLGESRAEWCHVVNCLTISFHGEIFFLENPISRYSIGPTVGKTVGWLGSYGGSSLVENRPPS